MVVNVYRSGAGEGSTLGWLGWQFRHSSNENGAEIAPFSSVATYVFCRVSMS
jgi:hypothetical protein